MQTPSKTYISRTETWLKEFIIDLNICPFARAVYHKDSLRIAVCLEREEKKKYAFILTEIEKLVHVDRSKIETSLLVFPFGEKKFEAFQSFSLNVQDIIEEIGLFGHLQVITFHPAFQYETEEKSSTSNFTNRSPLPMLHILREASIDEVIEDASTAEKVSKQNTELLLKIGIEDLTERLKKWQEKIPPSMKD